MIAVIRITGDVKLSLKIKETLNRIRLRRKYALILLKPTDSNLKLLKHIRNFVAYGTINEKTLKELIESRSQLIDKESKLDVSKIISNIDKSPLEKLGIKPFFRLHPPRGGIDSKKHFGVTPKAVLGDNKEKINDLIKRML
ncbi:hypothetical protein CMI45_03565 [Candidatus Pacearchaeota archaeon]|nr:hypothetical protein [Candidatus Pacearchaeota archaeon]|tara:strand:+ start:768 stop:1190 length:423 start_codon:yes stop_codon:yes gene_type:complete